ncbi:MAG: GNAT family protein [Acidimicrobiia bacterium]|nr:GNAT family protein [Acidimicrobiia bacterium]
MAIAPDARNEYPPIETDRLVLSPGTADDAGVLFPHVHGDAGREVTDTLIWDGPDAVDDLVEFFALHMSSTFAQGGFHWLLRDRTGELTGGRGQAIGSIGLEPGAQADECAIGYWLAPPFWGKGLMGEAIVAVSQLAFSAGYELIEATVFVHNGRGCALVEKLGFRKDKRVTDYAIKRGVPRDAYRYVATESTLAT